jgi:hypothetical protein
MLMVSNEARAKGRATRALTTSTYFLAHLFVKTCTLYVLTKVHISKIDFKINTYISNKEVKHLLK